MANPMLMAEFQLDESGNPLVIPGKKKSGEPLRHYQIKLFIDEVPADVNSVEYRLHSSYKEPTRRVPAGIPKFQEYITSYGDYPISVMIFRKDSIENVMGTLSEALMNNYRDKLTPEINKAIQDIMLH